MGSLSVDFNIAGLDQTNVNSVVKSNRLTLEDPI